MFEKTISPRIKLATAPVSWGVDHMGRSDLPAWQVVFDQIAEAGFRYTELGPLGYLPEDGKLIRTEIAKRKLEVVGAALLAPLGNGERKSRTLEEARRLAGLVSAAGGDYLILVDWSPERHLTAGRTRAAIRLLGPAQRDFHALVNEIGKICRQEYNISAAAHPHAGSYIEFEDEVDELMAGTESGYVELAIDTGHSIYAEIDPAALLSRYGTRTSYVNFKDISGPVLAYSRDNACPFLTAVDQGVFCCLGEGVVDFRAFCRELNKIGFNGPAVIEQDRSPTTFSSALDDAKRAIGFIRDQGLALV